MKSAFRCFQIVLLLFGVFGADEDEVKLVMEGDSVTLNPDLTQIKTLYLLEWRFGDPVIAQIDENDISYPSHSEIFRGRLQLDQTGSLTIKNMKTKHSGLYELQIRHSDGTTERKFNVTVYASASVAGKSEMKSVSVMEGDRVTLQTDVTLSGDELIVWRFGEEGKLIAKADIEAKSSPLYNDGRFRDRLKLEQTGSLIITDTRTTDSGLYEVKISSSKQTVYKRFTVTVSVTVSEPGLSSGAKAGIGVGVVFAVAAVAAAAVGFIYQCRKMSELRKQTLKMPVPVSVKAGDPVILKPNKAIKKDDYILWLFGDEELQTGIAEIRGEPREIVINDDALFGRFRGKLELDDKTGSLTIKNTTTEHSGLYTLHITSSGGDSEQRVIVTVNENVEEISVEEGGSVTLNPDTEIQRDNQMMWLFGDHHILIAEIKGGTGEAYDNASKRFSGRLQLNKMTGSLTIRNITAAHTGLYRLLTMSSSRGILCKKFRVFMPFECKVTAGDPVHLSTGLTKIERDDEIQWRFGDENSLIAEIKGGTRAPYYVPDERFRDRLKLNDQTGDLTIKNSTDQHRGRYKLKIHSRKGNTNKTYIVIIGGVAVTDKVRNKLTKKENNDSSGKRGNESDVEMQLLDE